MEYTHPEALVSTEWLAENLGASREVTDENQVAIVSGEIRKMIIQIVADRGRPGQFPNFHPSDRVAVHPGLGFPVTTHLPCGGCPP